MQIAIASTGRNLKSKISLHLGRSTDFIFLEKKDKSIKNLRSVENPFLKEKAAGNLAADYLVEKQIDLLISGELSHVAFQLFKNAGIKVYRSQSGSVKQNIRLFEEDKLMEIINLQAGFPACK